MEIIILLATPGGLFKQITQEMVDLYERKNKDYGDSFAELYKKYGMTSSLIRMEDKLNRLRSLVDKTNAVQDESKLDTLMDLANYAIMTIIEERSGSKN